MSLREYISLETVDGDMSTFGEYQITPQAQALSVHLPFAGFVWNRPIAVTVRKDGVDWRIPIVDVTRVTQISFFGLAMLLTFVLARTIRR